MIRFGLRQIEYFRAVMESGSVSGAAALLSVSQPNVSRMIKYTETRLGLTLFERSKGRLQPTPEALALFAEVQSLHLHLESLQDSVRRITSGAYRRFHVGASPSLGRHVVPSILSRLRRDLGDLPVKFDILSVSQIIDYLVFGQGECACTIFPIDHPQITTEAGAAGSLVCVVPRDHRLAGKRSLTAEALQGERLIGFEPNTPHGQVVEDFFHCVGEAPELATLRLGDAPLPADCSAIPPIAPQFATLVRFAESACALVEEHNGVALVDEFTISGGAFPNLVSIPVAGPKPFRIFFHSSAQHPLSIAGERFRKLLSAWPGSP
jgi:DNA-binding transcriptional LysR family regulator